MKSTAVLGLLLLSSFLPCFGDTLLDENINKDKCTQNKYDIIGNFDSKINSNLIFSIKNNFITDINQPIEVSYIISKDGVKIAERKSEKFNIIFSEAGNIVIKAKIVESSSNCTYDIQKEVNIYSKIVSYISDNNDLNLSFDDDFTKNNIFFIKTILEYKNTTSIQEQFLSQVTENLNIFQDSDIVIVNSENYLEILQGFDKLSNVYNINFANKKFFIITDSNFIFSKKILSNFINSLNINIYTFTPINLLNFLNYISTGKSVTDIINNKLYNIHQISLTSESNNFLFITNFTNKLIASGFPIGILGIIFGIGVSVTLINFIRQFVGISIFNLYYPIFFALSIYLFSLNFTLILFLSSLFSIFLMKLVFKKIHFLLNTKLSLFFIFYLIISIIIIGIFNKYNMIDFFELKSNLVVFPFIIIPMTVYKIFADERKIVSLNFVLYIFEFIFVSGVAYFTIKSSFIQNIFIAYTELLIVLFIINLLIGKFTGLQLLEYIRFLPLIKKHFQEE